MKSIILVGGSGTRLWPLSRQNYPKQFLKINSDKSFLQNTIERVKDILKPDDFLIIGNNEYKFHIKTDLNSYDIKDIIFEPSKRNTFPAIFLGIKYLQKIKNIDINEVIFVFPSDHIIYPVDKFQKYIKIAEEIAKKNHIITFGVIPSRPETGYGYIKTNTEIFNTSSKEFKYLCVDCFKEKPDTNTAIKYIEDGNYYWNSGIYAFTLKTIFNEIQKYLPELNKYFDSSYEEVFNDFNNLPKESIDYAISEKSKNISLIPFELYWNDVGSWDSLYDIIDSDLDGNVKIGDILTIDTKNSLFLSDSKKLISAIGIEDSIIINTDDAILIAKKGETQKVKDLVLELQKLKRKETIEHTTIFRPWGSYTVLEEGLRYKLKRIVVNPFEKLSLQMHYHRSEHWVIVKGTAKVQIDTKEVIIHENESAYVPKSTKHRLENPGKIPLEIIEIQNGEYLGEDDIVRFNDNYGRQ